MQILYIPYVSQRGAPYYCADTLPNSLELDLDIAILAYWYARGYCDGMGQALVKSVTGEWFHFDLDHNSLGLIDIILNRHHAKPTLPALLASFSGELLDDVRPLVSALELRGVS